MAGTGRIYVTAVRAVGDIQSTHQYDVDVRFDIAFDWGGYNYNGGAYTITCDGQNQNGSSTFAIDSGGGSWVWANIGNTKTFRITMPTSGQAKTIILSAGINTGVNPSYISASGSYTLSAVTWQWSVSYNANGGTGAPDIQTKIYGTNLTLSSTKPTRTGYTFLGWSTSDSATSATYSAGGTYSANSATILYAVWKINTYTVSYNANGGTGAPSAQTKTYGSTLTLSKTIPTRTNYNFKGWSTSSTATSAMYSAGGAYTTNSGVVLYAVWELAYTKPRIYSESVSRCDVNGDLTDSGTYVLVKFSWSTDKTVSAIEIMWKTLDATGYQTSNTVSVAASGTSGTVSKIIGSGGINAEKSYNIKIRVADSVDSSANTMVVSAMNIMLDFKRGGNGVAIGKPAELSGYLDVAYDVWLRRGLSYYGTNTIASVKDDTVANWSKYGNSIHFYNSVILTNQPSTYGLLINIVAGSTEVHQIWLTQASGAIHQRGGNGNGWSETWKCVLDGSNYYNYTMPKYAENISSLSSRTDSFLWNATATIPSTLNIPIYSKGIEVCNGGQDAVLMGVDAENNLMWGFRNNGNWTGIRRLGENKRLWSGCHYMTQDQTAYLSEAVSSQVNGIVLTFEAYRDEAGKKYEYHHFFVPKKFVANADGAGSNFVMTAPNFTYNCTKYLYIRDTSISGNYRNTSTGTNQGVSFVNHSFVLSAVYGV